ncbi:TPA: MipA/OmpV family protein, partial [Escherichia coli]
GVGVIDQPYKGYDSEAYFIPAVSYDGDSFWFRGLGGGYYLWNDAADTLSVMAYWSPMYFKPDDSNDHQLRRLDKRKSTVMVGVSWSHHTPYGFLRTSLAADVLDNSNGVVGDVAWSSQKQNDYYYGVSRRESAHSGLKRYKADNDWAPYLEVSANYTFASNWGIYGTARYSRLSDEVKNSPMVNRSWDGLFSTGITYRF